jgi:hypothetical protein
MCVYNIGYDLIILYIYMPFSETAKGKDTINGTS